LALLTVLNLSAPVAYNDIVDTFLTMFACPEGSERQISVPAESLRTVG
jgi:hypothetical protein